MNLPNKKADIYSSQFTIGAQHFRTMSPSGKPQHKEIAAKS